MSRGSKVAGVVGVVVLLVGLLWSPLIKPQLVKFPTNVDRAERYQGTLTLYVDQSTGAPLASPQAVPLTIDRHITSIGRASGAHVTLVDETESLVLGVATTVQENIFAIDRKTGKNVGNRQAVTFAAGNAVDRSGSYSLVVGRGVPSHGASYPIWKQETATTYTLHNNTPATGVISGVHVVNLTGSLPPTPVAAYEQKMLVSQGFPSTLTTTQVATLLQGAGVDLYETLSQLSNILTPTEMNTVTATVSRGIPLQYLSSSQGNIAVEPHTGIFVKVSNAVRGFYVKPDVAALGPMTSALTAHASDPTVASLLSTLSRVAAAAPQPVLELRYDQTPASIDVDASYAKSQARRLRMASVIIPLGLIALGVIILMIDALFVWRGRHGAGGVKAATEAPSLPWPGGRLQPGGPRPAHP